ncbi:class I SAM-dependent DNA methyltransferase [Elusimicrobiota bacterium]
MKNKNYRLYSDLSWIWPIITPVREYVEETELFSGYIKNHSDIKIETLLHLGCGGGHNDNTFKKHFKVTGIDISPDMLGIAGKLNPEVEYSQADMKTVRLGKTFDAVCCVDAICYMSGEKELADVFKVAYDHLNPGGVFLTPVEMEKDKFKQNSTEVHTYKKEEVEITYIENHYDPDLTDTSFEVVFMFLIRTSGDLEIERDIHECGIFNLKTWIRLLKETGFTVKQEKFTHSTFDKGKYLPLLLCKKPI